MKTRHLSTRPRSFWHIPHCPRRPPLGSIERRRQLRLFKIVHIDTPHKVVPLRSVGDILHNHQMYTPRRNQRRSRMCRPYTSVALLRTYHYSVHSQGLPLRRISRQCLSLVRAACTPSVHAFLIPSSRCSPTSAGESMIQTLSLEWKATEKKTGSGSGSPRRKTNVSLPVSAIRELSLQRVSFTDLF